MYIYTLDTSTINVYICIFIYILYSFLIGGLWFGFTYFPCTQISWLLMTWWGNDWDAEILKKTLIPHMFWVNYSDQPAGWSPQKVDCADMCQTGPHLLVYKKLFSNASECWWFRQSLWNMMYFYTNSKLFHVCQWGMFAVSCSHVVQLFLLLDLILTLVRGVRTKKQIYVEIAVISLYLSAKCENL